MRSLYQKRFSIDFESTLVNKGYSEIDSEDARFILKWSGSEVRGRLRKARVQFSMADLTVQKEVTCFYMTCGISDF